SRRAAWNGAKGMPEMNSAVSVCAGVRTALVFEPRVFTSSNSAAYAGEPRGNGPSGRNCRCDLMRSGFICDSQGSKNGAIAGGVGRQTPGAGGTSKVIGEEVLDLLARLVDKSLVVGEASRDGTGRYRLLET